MSDEVPDWVPEIHALATRLLELAADASGEPAPTAGSRGTAQQNHPHAFINHRQARDLAHHIHTMRRRRARYFDRALFFDPAWDMLLELYVFALDGRNMYTKVLQQVADVPATTSLRWIGELEKAGLIERTTIPQDRRVTLIALSDKGREAMERFLADELLKTGGTPLLRGARA